jgi:hypothetical protein
MGLEHLKDQNISSVSLKHYLYKSYRNSWEGLANDWRMLKEMSSKT